MDVYDTVGKRSAAIINVTEFSHGIFKYQNGPDWDLWSQWLRIITVVLTILIIHKYSLLIDPNSNRNGTEDDIRLLERTFVDTHGFDLDLNLQGRVTKQQAISSMIEFVSHLVLSKAKLVTVIIMSHGKANNWWVLSNSSLSEHWFQDTVHRRLY